MNHERTSGGSARAIGGILASCPADWKAGKVTPGEAPGTWVVELLDGLRRAIGAVVVSAEVNREPNSGPGKSKNPDGMV